MAYTFSHPAAILPIRKYLPFSALVVGSMAPDYLYFIPGVEHRHYGHTTQGVFTFCLPASFVVLWLFHRALKKSLLRLLPLSHQQRLAPLAETPFPFAGVKRILLLALTFLIAIETHIWWDAFTHVYGFFPKHFPALKGVVGEGPLIWSDVLQNVTSLMGLAFILVIYYRWLRKAAVDVNAKYYFSGTTKFGIWTIIAAISVMAAIVLPSPTIRQDIYFRIAGAALDVTRAFLLQLLFLGFLWMPRSKAQKRSELQEESRPAVKT